MLRAGGFDIVVSDLNMPNINGFGLLRRIRADVVSSQGQVASLRESLGL